jgi:hypothetical protein
MHLHRLQPVFFYLLRTQKAHRLKSVLLKSRRSLAVKGGH